MARTLSNLTYGRRRKSSGELQRKLRERVESTSYWRWINLYLSREFEVHVKSKHPPLVLTDPLHQLTAYTLL